MTTQLLRCYDIKNKIDFKKKIARVSIELLLVHNEVDEDVVVVLYMKR